MTMEEIESDHDPNEDNGARKQVADRSRGMLYGEHLMFVYATVLNQRLILETCLYVY